MHKKYFMVSSLAFMHDYTVRQLLKIHPQTSYINMYMHTWNSSQTPGTFSNVLFPPLLLWELVQIKFTSLYFESEAWGWYYM